MLDAALPPKRKGAARREIAPDQAKEKLLAKLQKAGAKGTISLIPAKGAAIFESVLEDLEKEGRVFIDRRKPKPRAFLWDLRPTVPDVGSVAEELCSFAANRFPLLCTPADFKKQLGKDREKIALLAAALESLIVRRRLAPFRHRSGKKELVLYASTAAFHAAFPSGESEPPPLEAAIESTYRDLVRRGGFPAVPISDLQQASGTPLGALQRWLLAHHQAGRAVLSLGDWSLATLAQQAAAIELGGERYLQARLLE